MRAPLAAAAPLRRPLKSTEGDAAASSAWAATWFNGSPNLTEDGTRTTSGFATEPSLAGSRVAYDPLTGKPVVIWSQGTASAGFQIVAGAGTD